MASPEPESASPMDTKPQEPIVEKEDKNGVNGLTSPKPNVDSETAAPTEKSEVNGEKSAESPKATNGDAEDTKMGEDEATVSDDAMKVATPSDVEMADEVKDEPSDTKEVDQSREETPKPAPEKREASQTEEAGKEDPKGEDKKAAVEATESKPVNASPEPKPTTPADDKAQDTKPDAPLPSAEKDEALPTSEVDLQPASLSQLALEGTDAATSPLEASGDVSMADAPTGKVAREREDDGGEEPAPKRARTEPKDDESTAAAPTPTEVVATTGTPTASGNEPSLDDLPHWNDPDNSAKEITDYQRREIRKSLTRVRKTKAGKNFKDSVQYLWPELWDAYVTRVEKPMDLGQIDKNMRDYETSYKTLGDFKKDLGLILTNTILFNGPIHEVTVSAMQAVKNVWEETLLVPPEEPTKPKPLPKAKPMREARVAPPAPAAPPAAAADTSVVSKPSEKPALDRRASLVADGDRPKRTVRAPKPKDIDYSTKASRKKLKPELQFCDEVLSDIMSPKNAFYNEWFMNAVDAEGLGIPNYYAVIKNPMHLLEISRQLGTGEISNLKDFDKKMRLIFANCYEFNGAPPELNPVSVRAAQLEEKYNESMKGKDEWLSKHAKANPPAVSNSNASEDDEEAFLDEDDEDDISTAAADANLKNLQAKLKEEMAKLTELFQVDDPDAGMIEIQQSIVNMVQQGLLKAKQKANEARSKGGAKPKKPASKPSKPKSGASAGAAAGRKGQLPSAQPKKTGPAKNKKKNLTTDDKNRIVEAINDLEGSHLDRAIEIIKRDTGENEDDNGELELEIEALSPEALLKLWELCKKALPGFAAKQAHKPAAPAAPAPKPKKNKPMTAQEQEARIAQLRELRGLYKPGQEPDEDTAPTQGQHQSPAHDSSDDSSEEE